MIAGTMLDAWRPAGGTPAVLVRWLMTEWCNYRCPYCPQTHERHAPKEGGFTAHAFDNFPVEQWLDAFERHFAGKRLSLVLTGGEPMIDRKAMPTLLNALSAKASTECIRIDTNAWWKPEQFSDVDPAKIILMCTFHPSHIEEGVFLERMLSFKAAGFKIGIVNYVMNETNLAHFSNRHARFAAHDLVLHPNPLWQQNGLCAESDVDLLRKYLPPVDFAYRTQTESPAGKLCHFPSLSYEMNYAGIITAGCLYENKASFFDRSLPPNPSSAVPCPIGSCVCLDKYSFLDGVERNLTTNPLAHYSTELRRRTNPSPRWSFRFWRSSKGDCG